MYLYSIDPYNIYSNICIYPYGHIYKMIYIIYIHTYISLFPPVYLYNSDAIRIYYIISMKYLDSENGEKKKVFYLALIWGQKTGILGRFQPKPSEIFDIPEPKSMSRK